MILVSTGTNGKAFDRLLKAVGTLQIESDMVVQHGPSRIRPSGARCVSYVSFDEYAQLVRDADAVVTHAGAGSVLVALMNGKRPLVVPRLARFNEAIDDHQLVFAHRLAASGLVHLVEEPTFLQETLQSAELTLGLRISLSTCSSLTDDLCAYLQNAVAARARDQE